MVSLPKKFRKRILILPNYFFSVDPIREGNKVKEEVSKILSKSNIKYIYKNSLWPSVFKNAIKKMIQCEQTNHNDSIFLAEYGSDDEVD